MPYCLAENNGDSIAVPRLVFQKLADARADWVRVALYVLDTGDLEPASIARALRLRGEAAAKDALMFWRGAGLLADAPTLIEPVQEAAPTRKHLTTPEVTAVADGDANIAALVQECQRLMGEVITQADINILVSMYVSDNMPVDMILLGVAYFASKGKRSARYIERALLGWQRDGIETGEQTELYLQQLAKREEYERRVAALLGLAAPNFTKAERGLIASWYEQLGYEDDIISEAISYAGEKNSVRYVAGILRKWYAKGYKTLRDVIHASADAMQNVQPSNPNARNVLTGAKRAPTFKPKEDEL